MSPENNRIARGGAVVPRAIRRRGPILEVQWDDAGHLGAFETRAVRLACPCAGCVEEMTGRPLLDPATVPLDITAEALEAVGGYGLRIRWSDGHSTGIYTYGFLLARCPCPACTASRG
jgi:ATP-binding protein involved in chromosome partitioning